MRNNLKIIIILLVVLLIVTVIISIILNKTNNSKNDYSLDSVNIGDYIEFDETGKDKVEYEKNCNTYYTIISIIDRYIEAISLKDSKKIIDMYDSKYINDHNINGNNILEFVEIKNLDTSLGYYEFEPNQIYSVNRDYVTVHFVYGNYYNVVDMEKKELNLMIELDSVNQVFNIYNYQYIKDNGYDKLKIGDLVNFDIDKIEDRVNNKFEYLKVSNEEMAQNYINSYKNKLIYDKKTAYNMLSEEYSRVKFKNIEDFEQYVENKKIEYFTATIKEYKVEISENGGKIYICKDEKDNYYYFMEEDGVLMYKAVLDNYVIPNEEFIKQYNKMSEQEKVIVNIKKLILGINDKSYYYLYNLLSTEFKQNYFKSQESFENYIKENFFENNEATYGNFEEQNGIYIYNIKIINADNENESIEKTIIMKLNEGTNFEMSFNVN